MHKSAQIVYLLIRVKFWPKKCLLKVHSWKHLANAKWGTLKLSINALFLFLGSSYISNFSIEYILSVHVHGSQFKVMVQRNDIFVCITVYTHTVISDCIEYLCLYDGGCLVVLYTMLDYCDYDNTNYYNITDLQMSHRIPHYPSFIQLLLHQ